MTTAAQGATTAESKRPIELFEEFYSMSNGGEMSAEQHEFVQSLIEKIWEGEE